MAGHSPLKASRTSAVRSRPPVPSTPQREANQSMQGKQNFSHLEPLNAQMHSGISNTAHVTDSRSRLSGLNGQRDSGTNSKMSYASTNIPQKNEFDSLTPGNLPSGARKMAHNPSRGEIFRNQKMGPSAAIPGGNTLAPSTAHISVQGDDDYQRKL